jgi:phosphate/sulfate permease
MTGFLLVAVIVLAGVFTFINGFHDVSNSVAVAVRTRALTPTVAVVLAAFFNLIGALLGTGLALVLLDAWTSVPPGRAGLVILIASLAGASLWGLFTWWRRMPSSSTHAILAGVVGAGSASGLIGGQDLPDATQVLWLQILLPLLVSPVVAFILGFLLVYPAVWISRYTAPGTVHTGSRRAQSVLAACFSLGHGIQDGQRSMAVVAAALIFAGVSDVAAVPLWVQLYAAVMIAVGSLFGGWRISHTLSDRLVAVDPMRGMISQGLSSVMLFFGALTLQMPLSSTHTLASSVIGAGANQRFGAVRWPVVGKMLMIWILTLLVSGLVSAIFFLALSPVIDA